MGITDQLFKIPVMKMLNTFSKTIYEQNKEAENIFKKAKQILELKKAKFTRGVHPWTSSSRSNQGVQRQVNEIIQLEEQKEK